MHFPQIMMSYFVVAIISLLFIQINGINSDNVQVSKEQSLSSNFFPNSPSRRQKRFEPITTALGIGAVAALYHGVKWWKRRNRKKKYRQNYQRMDTIQRWQKENNGRKTGGGRRRTTSFYERGPPISKMKEEMPMPMPPPQMNGGGNSGGGGMPTMDGGGNGGGGEVPVPPPQVKNDGMVPAPMPNYDPIMIAKLAQKYAEYTSASDKLKYLADEAQKKLATFQKDLQIQLKNNFEGHPIPYPLSGQDTLDLFEMIELAKSSIFAGTLAVPIIEKVKKADPNTKHIISQKLAESLVTAIMDPFMQEKDKFEAKTKVIEKIATEIGP